MNIPPDPMEQLEAEFEALSRSGQWAQLVELGGNLRRPSFKAALWIGNAYCELGKYPQGVRYLRRAARMVPESAIAQKMLGCALFELGQLRAAELPLLRAIAFGSGGSAERWLSNVYMDQGRLAEGEWVLRARIRYCPSEDAMKMLADYLFDIGKEQEAEVWYERAKQAPDRKTVQRLKEQQIQVAEGNTDSDVHERGADLEGVSASSLLPSQSGPKG